MANGAKHRLNLQTHAHCCRRPFMASPLTLKSGPAKRAPARTMAPRRGVRTRTIPEQIADHVAVAIIKAEFRDGEHLPEQKIASLFDVSHGPVREAIRAL